VPVESSHSRLARTRSQKPIKTHGFWHMRLRNTMKTNGFCHLRAVPHPKTKENLRFFNVFSAMFLFQNSFQVRDRPSLSGVYLLPQKHFGRNTSTKCVIVLSLDDEQNMFLVMNRVAIRDFGILRRAFCMKSRDLAIETIPEA